MNENYALVLLGAELTSGLQQLKKATGTLTGFAKIVAASSIYKRYHSQRREDLNSEIYTALLLQTKCDLFELAKELEQIPDAMGASRSLVAILLAFNNEVRMTPSITLPHPSLYLDPLVLKCSTEVYGKYLHPVLGKSLDSILANSGPGDLVEFFAQPKALAEIL